jgi:hypothetical protein
MAVPAMAMAYTAMATANPAMAAANPAMATANPTVAKPATQSQPWHSSSREPGSTIDRNQNMQPAFIFEKSQMSR